MRQDMRDREGKGIVPVLLIAVGILFFLVMLVLPLVEVIYHMRVR